MTEQTVALNCAVCKKNPMAVWAVRDSRKTAMCGECYDAMQLHPPTAIAWFEVYVFRTDEKPMALPIEWAEDPRGWLGRLRSLNLKPTVQHEEEEDDTDMPSKEEFDEVARSMIGPQKKIQGEHPAWFAIKDKKVGRGHSDSRPHSDYGDPECPSVISGVLRESEARRVRTHFPEYLSNPIRRQKTPADPDDLDQLLKEFTDVDLPVEDEDMNPSLTELPAGPQQPTVETAIFQTHEQAEARDPGYLEDEAARTMTEEEQNAAARGDTEPPLWKLVKSPSMYPEEKIITELVEEKAATEFPWELLGRALIYCDVEHKLQPGIRARVMSWGGEDDPLRVEVHIEGDLLKPYRMWLMDQLTLLSNDEFPEVDGQEELEEQPPVTITYVPQAEKTNPFAEDQARMLKVWKRDDLPALVTAVKDGYNPVTGRQFQDLDDEQRAIFMETLRKKKLI